MIRILFGHPERLWTKEEDKKLAELYWARVHIEETANILNRSRMAISHRQERLGILGRKRIDTEETKTKWHEQIKEASKKDPRKWTKEQMKLLHSLYPSDIPIDEVAQRIGKNKRAIKIQASRQSVKRRKIDYKKWSESQKRLLSLLYLADLPIDRICEEIGKTESAVRKQAMRQNLKRAKHIFTYNGKQRIRLGILNNLKERERKSKLMKEYNLTKKDYSTPWNKGKHPWDWMNITEEAFYKMIFEAQKRKPTSIEWRIIEIVEKYNLPYRYVGDGEIWICGKCPDFIHLAEKKLIEVQGDYWHTTEETKNREEFFKKHGFNTLFIWQSEMKMMTDIEIANRIRDFL